MNRPSSVFGLRSSVYGLWSLVFCLWSLPSHAQTEIRWQVETSKNIPTPLDIRRGESVSLVPQFLSYSTVTNIGSNTTVELWYRSADISNGLYYVITGSVANATNGQAAIPWTTAACAAATNYTYDIVLSTGAVINLRAFGTIRLLAGVYSQATTVTNPPTAWGLLDWSTISNRNTSSAPFLGNSGITIDGQSVTNGSAITTTGGAGISGAVATNIVNNVLSTPNSVPAASISGTVAKASWSANAAQATGLVGVVTADILTNGGPVAVAATNAQNIATSHVARVDNPHSVTAAQVGALTNGATAVSLDGTFTGTGTGLTITETDPAYSANTHATGMNQGVATTDSPEFTAVKLVSKNVRASNTGLKLGTDLGEIGEVLWLHFDTVNSILYGDPHFANPVNGSTFTNLNADELLFGTVPLARLPATVLTNGHPYAESDTNSVQAAMAPVIAGLSNHVYSATTNLMGPMVFYSFPNAWTSQCFAVNEASTGLTFFVAAGAQGAATGAWYLVNGWTNAMDSGTFMTSSLLNASAQIVTITNELPAQSMVLFNISAGYAAISNLNYTVRTVNK